MISEIKYKALLIIIIFLSSCELSAQTIICNGCGQPIKTHEYIKAEGKYFHIEHFKCASCGKSIAKNYNYRYGKFYHVKCYEEKFAKICDHCSKPISGKYFVADGKVYHQKCYENFIAKKCALCGEIINGEYILDFWGNHYHAEHSAKKAQCEYCGRFISDKLTNGGMKYKDGRSICRLCYNTSVSDHQKAFEILMLVRDRLALKGIKIPTNNLTLHLVDSFELNKRSSQHGIEPDMRGFANYEFTVLGDKIVNKKFDIYLLLGMPRDVFASVAAHELMHVWYFNFGKDKPEKRLVEGSCNYASYLINNDIGTTYKGLINDQLNKNPDTVYGDGFRSVRKYVDRYGIQRWLDHLKKKREMPSGY